MPSASPSPVKRPSLTSDRRTSSTHSLSSSAKLTTSHKAHRPHVVSRHSRNVSSGKGLGKLGKINSTANIIGDTKSHQRKRSGGTIPATSPRASTPNLKRNSSHVVLVKNTSHGNLRKNHSANALAAMGRVSHPALKKAGLAPAPKPKDQDKKTGFFELGDQSSGGEEDAEWEDSTTQSPEMTRNNSKTSTPARIATPNGDRRPADRMHKQVGTDSPPSASLKTNNRSAPNLRRIESTASHRAPDPAHLEQNLRSSRAPPAMSTVLAHAARTKLHRDESTRSFTQSTTEEAESPGKTMNGSGRAASSSGDGGVSHFLSTSTPDTPQTPAGQASDDDSTTNFMSNYRPQASESPEKPRMNKARLPHVPSRTQQKLELQRRETMRAGAATPTTPPVSSMGFNLGSSASLHSRSGSRGRNRSAAGDIKAIKQDYETAIKQLTVARRFRNPMLESLNRLKEGGILLGEVGVATSSGMFGKSRPPSRRGLNNMTNMNGSAKTGISRSLEDSKKPSPIPSRSSSRGRASKVQFQVSRQGSHDDIGLTTSAGSPDGVDYEEQDGISPAEALIRRVWESREVYDPGDSMANR